MLVAEEYAQALGESCAWDGVQVDGSVAGLGEEDTEMVEGRIVPVLGQGLGLGLEKKEGLWKVQSEAGRWVAPLGPSEPFSELLWMVHLEKRPQVQRLLRW